MLIEINNWEKYNPRQDVGRSSWFRLENNFWFDPAISKLTTSGKLTWICLLSIASQTSCKRVAIDFQLICSITRCRKCKLTSILEDLATAGKITITRNVDVTSASRGRNVDVSLRTNERTNERTEDKATPPTFPFLDIWNTHCGPLPKPDKLTKSRQAKLKARLAEEPRPDYWVSTVQRLAKSDFATGKNDRQWKASIDWLLANDSNHVKVNEGKYDNRKPKYDRGAGYEIITDLSKIND
tara:strand:- start:4698 stop:5417 length:720 start_codon:yes stop_codon:yes gene_type:complete